MDFHSMKEHCYSIDTEKNRSKIFRYLFACEKQTNGRSPFLQIKNIMMDFNKSKNTAENYIIEFSTQYETIVSKYIPEKDQVYGELHYKTLSANLQKLYSLTSAEVN